MLAGMPDYRIINFVHRIVQTSHFGAIAQLVERLVRKQIWHFLPCFTLKWTKMALGALAFVQKALSPKKGRVSHGPIWTEIFSPGVTNGGDNFPSFEGRSFELTTQQFVLRLAHSSSIFFPASVNSAV
jgi:hypothetical protein